jgi:hypothetical protein
MPTLNVTGVNGNSSRRKLMLYSRIWSVFEKVGHFLDHLKVYMHFPASQTRAST